MSPLRRLSGRTFASVRKHRNYRLYFAGQAISFTGSWMQQVAAAWLVLELTHSPVAVGALALCQLLPVSVLGLFVGTLLDRIDRRSTVIVTESLQMLAAAALAGLTLGGWVTVWEIYLLAVVQGIVGVFDSPARHALVFEMVGVEDLANAVALNSSLGTLARILGPAVGGLVVAFAGAGVAFALNAVSFLAILISLLLMDPTRFMPAVRDRGASVLGGALDALRFVFASTPAAVAFLAVFALATFSFNYNVLLPLLASRTLHGGAQIFGLLASVFGAGALCGAMINATRGRASMRLLLGGAAGFGVFELALASTRSLSGVCVLLFAAGVTYTLWGTNALSLLQLEAPERLRGRAAGLYFFAFQGGAPLGGLLAGWLVALDGTPLAFELAGCVALATALCGFAVLRRSVAQRREPASATSAVA